MRSYCNSIIQCLYYSHAFREHVIQFPKRSPPGSLATASATIPPLDTDITASNGGPISPSKGNGLASPRTKAPATTTNGPNGQPKEENKDSTEYKKKQLIEKGPVIAMDYENSQSYGMSESLFSCLKDIFEAIIAHPSRMGVVSPHKFLEVLRRENEMFRTPMHQDAHEFLNLLLNEVVENVEQFSKQMAAAIQTVMESDLVVSPQMGLKTPTVMSSSRNSMTGTGWVHELFEGLLTSETRCLTCENLSQRDEAFLDLSVDLEQHSSVTSCLRKFSEEEMLCERNKFHCDKCGGLQEAEKRMKIKRLPRILALHLKRFKYTEDLQRLQKLFHRVVYPYHLRLFNTTDDAEDPDRLYELYAVVVHLGGGPYHGHYVSIIKTQDRGWLLFDDELVEPVDQSYVTNFFGGEGQMACAYVLFYQETTLEAVQREQEAQGMPQPASGAESTATKAAQNGAANAPLATPTPLPDDLDSLANPLTHAATVPPPAHAPVPGVPLTPTPTSPNIPTTPPPQPPTHSTGLLSPLRSKKSHGLLQSKVRSTKDEARRSKDWARKEEERARKEEEKARKGDAKREKTEEKAREKERREAEKEAEKQRRKEAANLDDDLQRAIQMSKASKHEEDEKRKVATDDSSDAPTTAGADRGPIQAPNGDLANGTADAADGRSHGFMGEFNRFRQTSMSMSLRHKPKFWSGKEKDKSKAKEPERERTANYAPSSSTADSSNTSVSNVKVPLHPLGPVKTDPGTLLGSEPLLPTLTEPVKAEFGEKPLPAPPIPPEDPDKTTLRHARSQSYTLNALARGGSWGGKRADKGREKEREKENGNGKDGKEKKSRFGMGKKKSTVF